MSSNAHASSTGTSTASAACACTTTLAPARRSAARSAPNTEAAEDDRVAVAPAARRPDDRRTTRGPGGQHATNGVRRHERKVDRRHEHGGGPPVEQGIETDQQGRQLAARRVGVLHQAKPGGAATATGRPWRIRSPAFGNRRSDGRGVVPDHRHDFGNPGVSERRYNPRQEGAASRERQQGLGATHPRGGTGGKDDGRNHRAIFYRRAPVLQSHDHA